MAHEALKGYEPTLDEQVQTKRVVFERARELGLNEAAARDLASLATQGMAWTAKKFVRCLELYTDERIWQTEHLFVEFEPLRPKKADFTQALKLIYRSRSAALHTGESLPATVGVGTSPDIPIDAMGVVFSGEAFLPPVTWFERVVHVALRSFIESQRVQARRTQSKNDGLTGKGE